MAQKDSYTRSYPHYPQAGTMAVVYTKGMSSSKICFVICDKVKKKPETSNIQT